MLEDFITKEVKTDSIAHYMRNFYNSRNYNWWTNERIKTAMNSSKEKWVTLDKTVPAFITYFTLWVDEDGVLHFADDVYRHDKKLAAHLSE